MNTEWISSIKDTPYHVLYGQQPKGRMGGTVPVSDSDSDSDLDDELGLGSRDLDVNFNISAVAAAEDVILQVNYLTHTAMCSLAREPHVSLMRA